MDDYYSRHGIGVFCQKDPHLVPYLIYRTRHIHEVDITLDVSPSSLTRFLDTFDIVEF